MYYFSYCTKLYGAHAILPFAGIYAIQKKRRFSRLFLCMAVNLSAA